MILCLKEYITKTKAIQTRVSIAWMELKRELKTWKECTADDIRQMKLRREDACKIGVYMSAIWGKRQTQEAQKHKS